MSWPKIKNIIGLNYRLLLFYATTTNHFSIGLWCVTKSGFYMTTKDNQLTGWTNKQLQSTSQTQTCKKKKKSHGHFLVVCWRSDPLWLSESQQNHYIWEVRSASRWDAPKTTRPVAGIGQQNGPNSFPQQRVINSSKVEWIGLWCWFSHHIHLTSHQKTISSSSISSTFCRENASITSRRQKMLSKGSLNPEAWIFTL